MSLVYYTNGKDLNVWLDTEQLVGLSSKEVYQLAESLRKQITSPVLVKSDDGKQQNAA